MTVVPRWVKGSRNDHACHLTIDDRVALCGEVLSWEIKRAKKLEPEPSCLGCVRVFESRWS